MRAVEPSSGESLRQWARDVRQQSKQLVQEAQHRRNVARVFWMRVAMQRAAQDAERQRPEEQQTDA